MQHETLGEIQGNSDGGGVAQVAYNGRMVRFDLDPDDATFEEVVHFAASVAKQLVRLDTAGKQVAAEELTETYNGGWNEYEEEQPDGTFKTISNPPLSEAEFVAKLSLQTVVITGDSLLELYYDNDKMFWGHSVVVTSMDGVEFCETTAQVFG